MGKRGPPRTPTNVLRFRGSWRADRRENEPEGERGRPICPSWLDPEAKKVWRKLLPLLETLDVLRTVDGFALARYCTMYVQWKEAVAFVREHGETYPVRNAKGQLTELKVFPQVNSAFKLADRLLRLESHFGLTPSARASLATESPESDSDKGAERFFAGAG